MTITDEKYFREHSDVVQVSAYALHDVLHALKNDNCECLVSKEDGHIVVHYCKKRKEKTDDKSSACTDCNSDSEQTIDLHDWNDVSNKKIPLNEEIFALLEDRQNPEKLRPEVIVAKMMPAKRLTWTESKEGYVLCYDVPAGNFNSCNGSQIKYWKPVDIPVRTRLGNIEGMQPISKKEFDSLVSDVLEKFPDASLSEYDGRHVINYRGRQFDLENTYFLSKRPDFVRLLEQDMRSFNEYVRAIKDQK
jgi:hypothetical protein